MKRDEWGDHEVDVTIRVKALVAGDRDDPETTVRNLLDRQLDPLMGDKYDWGGRFVIVTDREVEIDGVTA